MRRAFIWTRRQLWTWICCIAVIVLSFWSACFLRFDFSIPVSERAELEEGFVLVLLTKGLVFCALQRRLDRWSRYSGFQDAIRLLNENLLASALSGLVLYSAVDGFPRSVVCLDFMSCLLASSAVQFAGRALHEALARRRSITQHKGLVIYGAGVAGLALAREVRSNPLLGYRVVGFLDDDPRKRDAAFLGFPVLGAGADAGRVVAAYRQGRLPIHEIVVAMPSAPGRQIREAVRKGHAAGVPCRVVPSLGELISGKLHIDKMGAISVTDLLGREHVNLNEEEVRREVAGRVVLVTGAAGSIGSELCAQLARFEPRHLVAVDQAESEVFRLTSEMTERFPDLRFTSEVADMRSRDRVMEILQRYEPDSIFHAAAYKHVPVMESQVCEAVRNNVLGTWNLAQAAWYLNVPRFLLISTDKAVNPSSVMGLTKRVAELIVSAARPPVGRGKATRFVCVRFGNVLVSNGSVVPIFQKQIARGGPVTVTHPEVCRYFMTVQEAVQLVLQASTLGKGSEIFVLDMGKPMRVAELARRMILLAGFSPGDDIEIRYVGLRPGEKLFEEISLDSEHHLPTANPKIRIFQNRQIQYADLVPWISELQHLLWRRDPQTLISHLRQLVPEYAPQSPGATPQTAAEVPVPVLEELEPESASVGF